MTKAAGLYSYSDYCKFTSSDHPDMSFEEYQFVEKQLRQLASIEFDIQRTIFPLKRDGKKLKAFADGRPYVSLKDDLRAALKS